MANENEESIPADAGSEAPQESQAPAESDSTATAPSAAEVPAPEPPSTEPTPDIEQTSVAPSSAAPEQISDIAPPSETKQSVSPPETTTKSGSVSASTKVSPPETLPPSEPTLEISFIEDKPLATSSMTETTKRVSSVGRESLNVQKSGAPIDDRGRTGSRLSANEMNRKSRQSLRTSKDGLDRRRSSKSRYMTSLMSIKRGSYSSYQERSKVTKYMNNYKLESEKPFNPDKVHAIIVQVLTETIDDTMHYDHEICPTKAKLASSLIRSRVKEQEYDRYKLVCIVTIGEKKNYDIFTGVRFLWDAERDRFATYLHENMYIFALATVFGIYYE